MDISRSRRRGMAAMLAALLLVFSGPMRAEPAARSHAMPTALATKALMLHAARAGKRLVAVGEYGIVILSDDAGQSWRQASSVPTRTTLTAVHFIGERNGWAVGHGGVVLASEDGGENWVRQAGKTDGGDILFSVWFKDLKRGYAVGSYGYAITSADGGKTWDTLKLGEGEDAERHLNQIFPGPGGMLFVAAETGRVFRSNDEGKTWKALSLPYKGSLWGGTRLADDSVLVWGMRGHALRSTDKGETWVKLQTGTDQSVTSAIQLENGKLVLAGLAGAMSLDEGGLRFSAFTRDDRQAVTSMLAATADTLILFTQTGLLPFRVKR
jgi:photosystem II stability/assembly factor-like uncharacterized protein